MLSPHSVLRLALNITLSCELELYSVTETACFENMVIFVEVLKINEQSVLWTVRHLTVDCQFCPYDTKFWMLWYLHWPYNNLSGCYSQHCRNRKQYLFYICLRTVCPKCCRWVKCCPRDVFRLSTSRHFGFRVCCIKLCNACANEIQSIIKERRDLWSKVDFWLFM